MLEEFAKSFLYAWNQMPWRYLQRVSGIHKENNNKEILENIFLVSN